MSRHRTRVVAVHPCIGVRVVSMMPTNDVAMAKPATCYRARLGRHFRKHHHREGAADQ